MHLVADPEKYLLAVKRGVPFYRTACGRVEPLKDLSVSTHAVTCPVCVALIQQAMAAQSEPDPLPPAEDAGFNSGDLPSDFDDDIEDLDALESSFDEPVSEEPTASSSSSPLEMYKPLLEALFADFDPDPAWVRWTMTPDSDPQGSEGMGGDFDYREVLDASQSKFIIELANLSQMIGLEGLSSRVLTLLHQVVSSGVDDPDVESEDEDVREMP